MSDGLYGGPRFRTFNVIDDYNREAVAIEIDTSLRGQRLIRLFERIKAERGLPDMLRVDNGPELLGDAFTAWMRENGVFIDYIEPAKPNQNAYIERFNRTYRNEVLNLYLFRICARFGRSPAGGFVSTTKTGPTMPWAACRPWSTPTES